MRKCLFLMTVLAGVAGSTAALGQPTPTAEIAAIRGEIAALSARLERLERSVGAAAPTVPAPVAAPPTAVPAAVTQLPAESTPKIRFAGDMRYRHEAIDEETEAERHRHRIRARFGVTADVADNVRVGLQLASGGDDPVSANQTLDDGFNRKPIGIDRAYFSWAATEQLTFTGGKMPIPFMRPGDHHLIYDTDLNPEGLALRYTRGNWFVNYAGLWAEERSSANDSIVLGGQFGYRRTLDNDMRLMLGASYFDYLETQNQAPFWDGAAAGNRVTPAGLYLNDFNLAELFAELELKVNERPVTLFADYVNNTEASDADTGYALGAALGEVDGPGTWRVAYIYQDLAADAVIGTFTDSDWAGGGTDGKGHVVEFSYGFRERLSFGFRYFLNERGADAGDEHDFHRLQADVVFNY